MIQPLLYKGLTKEGEWVRGNLVYTTDCEKEHQAITILLKIMVCIHKKILHILFQKVIENI